MTWVTWRQYRYQGALAAALLAALAVVLLITGLARGAGVARRAGGLRGRTRLRQPVPQ